MNVDTTVPARPVLEVTDIHIRYGQVQAVRGVSFEVPRATTFGIVGESGSGKSTTAMGIMRLKPLTSGRVLLKGQDISTLEGEALRKARRNFQLVFQDPYSSLNPRFRAGQIVREPMDRMSIGSRLEREERVRELFAQVGLRPEQRLLFPHQFSGGQRQRIGLARAIATRPELVVCDEPVSALDVAVQAQTLNLLRRLQEELELTYVFISHDLGVVQYMCDDIAVMYLGEIVERADRDNLFRSPQHPYTRALLSAVPSLKKGGRRASGMGTRGETPNPESPPAGCGFSGRCPFATDRCREERPALSWVGPRHQVACHLVR